MPRKKKLIKRSVVVGHKPNGEPVVKWYSGYTEKELAANRQKVLRDYTTGSYATQTDIPYRYYVQQWYDTYKKSKLSPSSKRSYENALNKHILPHIGDKQIRAISSMDLQKVVNNLEGKSKTLIGNVCGILNNTFRYAYAHGIIDRNPALAIERPGYTRSTRRALTEAEEAAALQVGKTHQHGLLIMLLYYTGMRRGEALGLRWGDVDFENSVIYVRRDIDFIENTVGKVKSEAAIREIPMPRPLLEALRPVRGLPSVYVIQAKGGSFLNQTSYKRWWAQMMAAMLEIDPTIERTIVERRNRMQDKKKIKVEIWGSALTPHYFRHNYASILYNAGVDVLSAQKILGHSDPKTTISIYTHLSDQKRTEDIEKIYKIFEY